MKIKDDQKYDRLIQAAIALLATGGLANFSTTKVAKQAGIPQSNLYIYFKNKQALLDTVFQTTIHTQSVAVVAELDTAAPITTQLANSIKTLYRFAREHPQIVATIQVLMADVQLKKHLHLKQDDDENQQIQTLLTDGMQAGILRSTDLNLIRYFLTRPVFNYAAGVQSGLYPDTAQGLTDLTQMIMGAILQPNIYQEWLTTSLA